MQAQSQNTAANGLYQMLSLTNGYLNKKGYCHNGDCQVFPVMWGEFGSALTDPRDVQVRSSWVCRPMVAAKSASVLTPAVLLSTIRIWWLTWQIRVLAPTVSTMQSTAGSGGATLQMVEELVALLIRIG